MSRAAIMVVVVGLLAGTASADPQPWFDAARDGDVAALKTIAGHRVKQVVNAVDDSGYSALILAAYHDQLPTVRWLVAHGASTCVADHRGFTALMGAVFRGHDRIVAVLAGKPCGADHVTAVGQTPLMLAALFGRAGLVRRLLDAGADPSRRDGNGSDARALAAAQGNDEIVTLLDAAAAARTRRKRVR